eukprot:2951626-Pyramimonas_sp.AAC.1
MDSSHDDDGRGSCRPRCTRRGRDLELTVGLDVLDDVETMGLDGGLAAAGLAGGLAAAGLAG